MHVYGVSVSYYTGKLEAYLRWKGLPYTMSPPYAEAARIKAQTGAIQVPMVLRDDGRWMSDTTPIIQHLEREHPDAPVIPTDPVVRFISLLVEDYADEWLWRPAMHYRWSFEHDRALLSRILADEVAGHLRVPRWLKLRRISQRQRRGFVLNDGVTPATRGHVEGSYRAALRAMSALLAGQPFLFGMSPTLADFGLMGPMLRHFGQDPTPQEIMRNEAPLVYAWVARVWAATPARYAPRLPDTVPAAAAPLLQEACETHLVQLAANATAFAAGARHFDVEVQGCAYAHLPVSRYRVWCLEQLRGAFAALSAAEQDAVRALLPWPEAAVLHAAPPALASGYDVEGHAPFNRAINVFDGAVPH